MAKHVIRSAEGEFLTSYEHLSEVNTYLDASFPGHTISKPKGTGRQTLTVKNDEGKEVAFVDIPDVGKDKDK